MPLDVESLTAASNDKEIQDKISASIAKCMREGKGTQEQCAGMVYGMARDKTGRSLDYGR